MVTSRCFSAGTSRVASSFALILVTTVAAAQQGQLDPSFGSSGKQVIPFDLGGSGFDGAFDVAVQPDGKIVLVGGAEKLGADTDFAAIRLRPDGSLDPTFGTGGKTTVWFDLGGTKADYAAAVALRPDGGIFLAGPVTGADGDRDFGIALLDSSGALDSNFNVGGKSATQFDLGGDNDDWAWDLALQADGKVLVAGAVDGSAGNVDFGVARWNPSVGIDLFFGLIGIRVVFFDEGGSNHDEARAIAVQPDGKIVLAGTVSVGDRTADFGVVRLNADSTNDFDFGNAGKVTIAFDLGGDDVDVATDLVLQLDGKIVVVGAAEAPNSKMDFAIARLLPDGTLDSDFDGDGKTTVSFDLGGDLEDSATAVALNPDGAIVVAGLVDGPAGDRDFGLARLDPSGALDAAFGTGGKTTIAFDQGTAFDDAFGLAVPRSGGIFVAGGVDVAPNGIDFGVAKVQGGVIFANGFES